MLTLSYEAGGVTQQMDLAVDSFQTLDKVLRRFSKEHLRPKIRKAFESEGPGWAKLAVSTIERLQATRVAPVTAAGKVRKSYRMRLGAQVRRQIKAKKVSEMALYELERLYAGGDARISLQSVVAAQLRSKAVEKLREKILKHEEQSDWERTAGARAIEKHRLLGKISSMIGAKVANGLLTVGLLDDDKDEKYGIHNVGGKVGHGAEAPPRTFAELEPEDLDVLAQMAADHMAAQQQEQDGVLS